MSHRVSQRLEERSAVAADERSAAATATEAQPQAAEVVVRPTPLAVSMRALHASIEADMRADPTITADLAVGKVKVPSLAAFEARMVPGYPSHATSSRYTGTAGIRWHNQRRSTRKYHPHAHYNSSPGRTLREWAISAQDAGFAVAFVSDDDKCKVSIGQPGNPRTVATRARRTVAGESARCLWLFASCVCALRLLLPS
jgi:hypothetical protein